MSASGATGPVKLLRWSWVPTPQAATPQAVVAHGETVRTLLTRVERLSSSQRERLSVVAAPGWLAVLGSEQDLPWVDGVGYAAPNPVAPALWLPTHQAPNLPEDLIAQALARQCGAGPLLLWHAPEVVLPLKGAQPAIDAVLFTARTRLGLSTGPSAAGMSRPLRETTP